jgi:hypothetical protein
MRRLNWQFWVGLGLLVLSIVLYFLLYEARPGRAEDIFFYTFLDLAFIPINVLFVGLILNGLLTYRERGAQNKRLNMLIGAFFSEVGTDLLAELRDFDPDLEDLRADLVCRNDWTPAAFDKARTDVADAGKHVDASLGDLSRLRAFLLPKRSFMLGMLQNPSLLEHERFTDQLWAVLHLADELAARPRLEGLPKADMAHLSIDIRRAWLALLREWLTHMQHLKSNYPYLFALAVRTNPFDPAATAVVEG